MSEEENLYKIGEVSAMLNLKSSVLRFWEEEFPELEPQRSSKGHRCYTSENVELLKRIKQLLHEQGMTIEGARRVISGEEAQSPADTCGIEVLHEIAAELLEVKKLLETRA